MSKSKSTFALFLGNRGLFPASLISGARAELIIDAARPRATK